MYDSREGDNNKMNTREHILFLYILYQAYLIDCTGQQVYCWSRTQAAGHLAIKMHTEPFRVQYAIIKRTQNLMTHFGKDTFKKRLILPFIIPNHTQSHSATVGKVLHSNRPKQYIHRPSMVFYFIRFGQEQHRKNSKVSHQYIHVVTRSKLRKNVSLRAAMVACMAQRKWRWRYQPPAPLTSRTQPLEPSNQKSFIHHK